MIRLDDGQELHSYFRQTPEYIFLDSVEVIPGSSAVAKKVLSDSEWFFEYHFPNNPLMPGVFQMEAIMQTAGLIINTLPDKKDLRLYFRETESVKILESARPQDHLDVEVTMISYKRGIAWFEGSLSVNQKVSCKMKFSLIAPDELIQMRR